MRDDLLKLLLERFEPMPWSVHLVYGKRNRLPLKLRLHRFRRSAPARLADGRHDLERFLLGVNREGFPNQRWGVSSCVLVKEAGMHGSSFMV